MSLSVTSTGFLSISRAGDPIPALAGCSNVAQHEWYQQFSFKIMQQRGKPDSWQEQIGMEILSGQQKIHISLKTSI